MGNTISCHTLHARLEAQDFVSRKVRGRLMTLLPDYSPEENGNAPRVLEISYLRRKSFPSFPVEPFCVDDVRFLSGERMTADEGIAIGFLNGLLLFRWNEGRAKLLLFADDAGINFLTGSAHRLTFISFSLWTAENNQFLVHSAAVRKGEKGYLFWGASGAGKSTVASFFPPEELFSDEAPLVYKKDGVFFCARTPFHQRVMVGTDSSPALAPIEKSFFLHKSDRICVTRRDRRTQLAEIMKGHVHGYSFMSLNLRIKAFEFFSDFALAVPAFDLYFPRSGDLSGMIN